MDKLYNVIQADPPWPAKNNSNRASPVKQGHYETMTVAEIEDYGLIVNGLARDESALFLWAPAYILLEGTAAAVCDAWGFVAKQVIPWVKLSKSGKPRIGMGNYTRVCAEYLVLAVRGRGPAVMDRSVPGVIMAERGAHSEKPDDAYRLIERLYDGPYIELFARRRYSRQWDVRGNEAPK